MGAALGTSAQSQCERQGTGFSAEAKDKLLAHPWRGNVRELRNAIERAVLLSEGTRIEASDLRFASAPNSEAGAWRPALPAAGVSLDDIERGVVMEALERHGFVQKEAAAWLGVSRRKLNYMIQRMGVPRIRAGEEIVTKWAKTPRSARGGARAGARSGVVS